MIYDWKEQVYTACVGLSKVNGKIEEYWNDMTFRKVKWHYHYIPFKWLTYDRNGIKIK
jgi:hypothetical protein